MAYWRRNPGQMQAATESVAVAAGPASAAAKPVKSPRPRMMRQYDLVERVRSYNPDTNEDLLNRAYVYAMKAHGTADPGVRRSLFFASARGRRDPHRPQARRRHHRRSIAARHHRGYRGDPRRNRPGLRARDRGAGGGSHQAEAAGTGVARGQAGREPAQAAAGDRRRRPRSPDQARRPPAQHAHAGIRAADVAPAHRRGDARHLCAAGRPHGHAGDAGGTRRSIVPHPRSGSLCGGHAAAGFAGGPQPQPDRRNRKPALQKSSEERRGCAMSSAGASSRFRSGPRWSASRSASSNCPISSVSAS